jgi:hypothetical protein
MANKQIQARVRTGLVVGVLVVSILLPAHAEERPPSKYLPTVQERERFSDIVCSATILKTQITSRGVRVDGEIRSQSIAVARVDRVFKGGLSSDIIKFEYYGLGPPSTSEYFGPPFANFRPGIRYVLFLRGHGPDLKVAIPFYQMEIQLAPQPPKLVESNAAPDLALARELLFAIPSAPDTIGRSATHYFSWAEELIGKQSIPLVEAFLNSSDSLVRYQAAWWLSFRKVNAAVINALNNTMRDKTIEEWARSGARDRLLDMREGKWLP